MQDRKRLGHTSTYINRAFYPKYQDLPDTPQLTRAGWAGESHSPNRAGVSGEGPWQSTFPWGPWVPLLEPMTGLSPYHAEVHTVGDGVSAVFCTSPLMPPSVPSPWMAAISLGLPSSLSITTCNRGKREATSGLQQKPPHGHFYGTICRVVLQTDVAGNG